jgi:putative ABC transport system permease protein
MSQVVLTDGRLPEAGHAEEVVLLASFADANGLRPGSTLPGVINGIRRDLRVVGTGQSPEFIYATVGEGIADIRRLGVLWMDRDAVAPAFAMVGAFDELVVRLEPGASEPAVIDAINRTLEPYGGLGAVGRSKQPSNMMLEQEFGQLRAFATSIPVIFLGVASFLLNVVLSRLVNLQRVQIATLKALGYTNREVGAHYGKLVGAIALLGAAGGMAMGAWLGRGMLGLYEPYFNLPDMTFRMDASVAARAILVSLAAAAVGGLATLRRVTRLRPAEAMQPEAPPVYRANALERRGLDRIFGGLGRMVAREQLRRPLRTMLSVIGIAAALMGLLAARLENDAIDAFQTILFESSQQDDVAITTRRAAADSVEREVAHLPGVLTTEQMRVVPVRIHHEHRSREIAFIGHPNAPALRRVMEWPARDIPIPPNGVMLTSELGHILDVAVGQEVELEIREGDRRTVRAPVVAFADEVFGLQAHATLGTLHRLLGEREGVSTVLVRVDPEAEVALDRRLREMPNIASVSRKRSVRENFEKQTAETSGVTTLILTLFSITIAIGVIYNDARVTLSLRARDLATLRVLGFRRREIAVVVIGELASNVVLALAPGLIIGGWALGRMLRGMVDLELMRYPMLTTTQSYGFAVTVLVAAAAATALVVRRRIDRLDMIAVLKTRE